MTIYTGAFSTRPFNLVLTVTTQSQDRGTNTSVLACTLQMVKTGAYDSFATGASYSATIDGDTVSGSFDFDFRLYGTLTLATWTKTVTHDADGNKSAVVSASATGSVVGSASLSGTFTPAQIFQSPAAPTSVVATRVSDVQATLAWTTNATVAAPYASQYVLRSTNGGAYANIGTASGSATTYTDNDIVAGNKYTYQIRANNTIGSATSSASAAIYTTPSAPSAASATKNTSNDIVVTWVVGCAYAEYSTEVWESQDGGAYALLTTVGTGVVTYTHTSPSALVTHAYKVRHKTSSGTALYSAYSSPSATISLVSTPNAPSDLAPNGTPQDASAGVVFTWTHNPTDSSPQSKFQIEHRLAGAGSWTTVTAVTSPISSWTLPAATYANGTTVEWHVRTYGESVTPSAYSATASFAASTPPTATISSPVDAGTFTSSLPVASWAYYDAEGSAQAEWQAELLDADDVLIQARSAATAAVTTSFTTALEDATVYTIRVRVRDGAGSWSAWDSVTFTTDFLPPANVTITPVFDEVHGWMTLTLVADAYAPGTTEPVVAVDVDRRRDGGAWVRVASGLSGDTVTVDKAPVTAGLNEYRAIVYSALPSSAVMATVAATVTASPWAYLSTGTGFGDVSRLYGNMSFGTGDELAKVLHRFAGRTKPVEFAGTAESSTVAVSGLLDSTSSTLDDFRARALARTICLWRDQTGRVRFGSLSGVSSAQDGPQTVDVSFTVTTVDYEG